MAEIITVDDVKDYCSTTLSDTAISDLIAFISQADACLDLNNIPAISQRMVKLYAVCHMVLMQQGGGVKSESDMNGESVTFAQAFDKSGLMGTNYGSLIVTMPGYECISSLLDKPRRNFNVVNYS